MGGDRMVVVDDQLRVHKLESFRVVAASVTPTVTSTNTNAPPIMIAERGADLIRQAARGRRPDSKGCVTPPADSVRRQWPHP
jgi:choline dehydrogenase